MLTSPRLLTAAAAAAATLLIGAASAAPPPLTSALEARVPAAATDDGDDSGAGGSFSVCDNADGVYAPFCQPAQNSSLYPGTTYYVTWDPSVFDSSNTTVIVEGFYVNTTTDEITSQAFSSPELEAGRSRYAWTVDSSGLPPQGAAADETYHHEAVSIALMIRALVADSNTTAQVYPGPTVVVVVNTNTTAAADQDPAPGMPTGAALYVGLPTVLGFCVLMIFGVCAWNRQARRIGLGNIMSRGRDDNRCGGGGGGEGRGRLVGMGLAGRRDRKLAIRLADHGPEDEDEDVEEERHYRDHDDGIHVGVARRDSDALGSLAGTPTSEHFPSAQEHKKS